QWYQSAQDAYRKNPATTERPETNASLAALAEQMQRNPAVFETEDELDLLRALRIADEFKLKPILFGNGHEYRVRKTLAEKKPAIVLPLDFPTPPEQGGGPGGVDDHAGGNVRRRRPARIDRPGPDGEPCDRERRPLCG